jgi:6-phosphogluconate dehydrogenase
MVGLDGMGRNLLLDMTNTGSAVSIYDKDPGKVEALRKESAIPTQAKSVSLMSRVYKASYVATIILVVLPILGWSDSGEMGSRWESNHCGT